MLQWPGKDQEHQQQRAMYWANQFGAYHLEEVDADKIRTALKSLQAGKCLIGNGRGKTAGQTKTINKTRSNTTVNRYRTTLSAIVLPPKVNHPKGGKEPSLNPYLTHTINNHLKTICCVIKIFVWHYTLKNSV